MSKQPTLILLSGKMGAGKTTASTFIHEQLKHLAPKPLKFADVLYQMHDAIAGILKPYGFSPKPKWGTLLQYLGTEFGRNQLSDSIWVDILINRVFIAFDNRNDFVIVDDMRFKNEWLDNIGPGVRVVRIRLECPEEIRKLRCENWRENSTHQSEIDLDDWIDKFDMVIHTDKTQKETEIELLRYLRTLL